MLCVRGGKWGRNKRTFANNQATEFGRFQPKFCAATGAWRRRGSGHCLLFWKLLLVGFLLLASLGRPVKAHDHPMSECRIAGQFHNFQGLMIASPWSDQARWISWKPWPKQHPGVNHIPLLNKHVRKHRALKEQTKINGGFQANA